MNLETKTETKQFDNLVTVQSVPLDEKLALPPSPKGLDLDHPDPSLKSLDDVLEKSNEETKDDNGLDGITGLDDDEEEESYKFFTSDHKLFELDREAVKLSKLADTMIEGDVNEKTLPMPNVDSSMMKHIVKYLKYHAVNPVPENNAPDKLTSNVFSKNIKCDWDVMLIENDVMGNRNTAKENLYSLIRASNYMDIQPLLQLACTKVACMIKGESLEAIKKIISTDEPYVDNHKDVL